MNVRPLCTAILAALPAAIGGCAHGDPPPPVQPMTEYRLGLDDVVDVTVWKEPALSAAGVPVRPDGKISLPMVGELPAAGRTAEEMRHEIAQRLARFVPDPAVSVVVKEVRATRFFVLGEVAHPGAYPLNGPLTVIEGVAVAGGTTEFASKSRVVVIRKPRGTAQPQRIRVSLDEIVDGRLAPLPLTPGDTIYVP
jgi:polysaccharide export outer membrane protein